MKADVKKIDGIKREILVEAEGDVIRNKFENVYKSISQTAKVPGFRPGHVPRDILEKNYSKVAHEQVARELIPDLYKEALAEHKLDVAELPDISDVSLDTNRIAFKATVCVMPEIKLPNYKGIKLKYKKITVDEDEVKRMLDSIKESHKLQGIDDSLAHALGYPDLATLRDLMNKQLFIQKQNEQRQRLESEIIDAVTKELKVLLPQSLVERQLQELIRQAKLDRALQGISREEIDAGEPQMRKDMEPLARRQVTVYLALSAIAKREDIPLDENVTRKAIEFLLRQAQWSEDS